MVVGQRNAALRGAGGPARACERAGPACEACSGEQKSDACGRAERWSLRLAAGGFKPLGRACDCAVACARRAFVPAHDTAVGRASGWAAGWAGERAGGRADAGHGLPRPKASNAASRRAQVASRARIGKADIKHVRGVAPCLEDA
jgi:hypothetical protein